MRKIITAILLIAFSIACNHDVHAQIRKTSTYDTNRRNIEVTGFTDYPPIGYTKYEDGQYKFYTVFDNIIEEISKSSNLTIEYKYNDNYRQLMRDAKAGKYDVVLGAYRNNKIHEGLYFVFPSILNNPISIITLPKTSGKLNNLRQLKELKGAVSNKEYLTDYVKSELNDYNIEYFDSSNAMFEKLFKGEIDYIFASHFFGIIETAKLGLRDRVSFSKQVIWNMPLFFGVSKLSPIRSLLVAKLSRYSEKPENKKKLEEHLKEIIYEIEKSYIGVVPPDYSN